MSKEQFVKALSEGIDHPPHYRADSGLEAIDVIEAWGLNFNLGNALKYIARAGLKNPETMKQDLLKALWYIQRELDNGNQ